MIAEAEKVKLDEEIITIEELLTALDGNLIDPQSAMIAATLSPKGCIDAMNARIEKFNLKWDD